MMFRPFTEEKSVLSWSKKIGTNLFSKHPYSIHTIYYWQLPAVQSKNSTPPRLTCNLWDSSSSKSEWYKCKIAKVIDALLKRRLYRAMERSLRWLTFLARCNRCFRLTSQKRIRDHVWSIRRPVNFYPIHQF